MAFLDSNYLLSGESAKKIFAEVKDLPVIDAHNHADVKRIADNTPFSDPWELFAATDHYVWEVMRKRSVPEKFITGDASAHDKFTALAEIFPDLAGNPVYEWIHLDLKFLGMGNILLDSSTGETVWNELSKILAAPEAKPISLIKKMNIEAMCSTDDPADLLTEHSRANTLLGSQTIHPTWRPDKYMFPAKTTFKDAVKRLALRFGNEITTLTQFTDALKKSHDFFAESGCRASDHGLEMPYDGDADTSDAEKIFAKALAGSPVTQNENDIFASFMMRKFAELDSEKGFVFQFHLGAVRDVRDSLYTSLGPDSGGDLADHSINIVKPLCRFLNKFDGKMKSVLYCLDPSHQADLAGVARAFGAMVNLGSAWWLNDTPIGMKRQLEYAGSVDLLANHAGMVSDSRKILSYASRFEMFRRVLADTLGKMVDASQMPQETAERLAVKVAYSNPKKFFNLQGTSNHSILSDGKRAVSISDVRIFSGRTRSLPEEITSSNT